MLCAARLPGNQIPPNGPNRAGPLALRNLQKEFFCLYGPSFKNNPVLAAERLSSSLDKGTDDMNK